MIVLTGSRCTEIAESLRTTLPARVLAFVSWHQPCHPLHLWNQVAGWFPTVDKSISEPLKQVLEWFEQRGDIYRGPRGLLYATPPYAVGDLSNPDLNRLLLVGHVGLDSHLKSWISGRGGQLIEEIVEDGQGFIRTMHLPPVDRSIIVPGLEQLGLHVVSPGDLLENMETIWDLDCAGPDYGARPFLGSGWQIYSPASPVNYQEGRWLSTDQFGNAILVRWSPPGEASRPWLRRYFLHGGEQQVSEIGRDLALWWIYRLDDENDRNAPWLYDRQGQVLRVSERLPSSVHRFLTAFVYGPVRYEDHWIRAYPIVFSHMPWIKTVGEKHLGLRVREV